MNDATDLVADLRRQHVLILLLTLLVGAGAAIVTAIKPVEYRTSISFSVNRINTQETSEYEYDGYYAIQASDLVSQTIVSWFLTPSVLLSIYERADIDPGITSFSELTGRFKARKYSAQNIVVTYVESDRSRVEELASAVTAVVEEKAGDLHQSAQRDALFEVKGSSPVIVETNANVWLATIIGLVAGWILGVLVASIRRAFRQE